MVSRDSLYKLVYSLQRSRRYPLLYSRYLQIGTNSTQAKINSNIHGNHRNLIKQVFKAIMLRFRILRRNKISIPSNLHAI